MKTGIVTITTAINPHNPDGELVAVYSKTPLDENDINELFAEYKSHKRAPVSAKATRFNKLVELPSCLGWSREDFPEVEKIETNLTKATGLHCYLVGMMA